MGPVERMVRPRWVGLHKGVDMRSDDKTDADTSTRLEGLNQTFTDLDLAYRRQTEDLEQRRLHVESLGPTSVLRAMHLWLLRIVSRRTVEESSDRGALQRGPLPPHQAP